MCMRMMTQMFSLHIYVYNMFKTEHFRLLSGNEKKARDDVYI